MASTANKSRGPHPRPGRFKEQARMRVLVAHTNLRPRPRDIEQLPHVGESGPAQSVDLEDYVHRIAGPAARPETATALYAGGRRRA